MYDLFNWCLVRPSPLVKHGTEPSMSVTKQHIKLSHKRHNLQTEDIFVLTRSMTNRTNKVPK